MKSYEKEITSRLLDIYERRGAYRKEANEIRAVSIRVADAFPEYMDSYNHAAYQEINPAIEALIRKGIIAADSSPRGMYEKLKLKVENVEKAYLLVKRRPLQNKCDELLKVIESYSNTESALLQRLLSDFGKRLRNGRKLPYGIEYDSKKLDGVMTALQAILRLSDETYVRNFSNALFKDSKVFQKSFRSTIQAILYDYTEMSVEKERILEVYNLYENPTYVFLKGNAVVTFRKSQVYLADLTGGISIPESALEDIVGIQVLAEAVITVENLTTFHDCSDCENLYIYLGGFHNHSKEMLLKKVFSMNPACTYLHKGDLDVYGFAILESLKERTGIPFEPLEMDLDTLRKLYEAGLYKELTEADKKAMTKPALRRYEDIFRFMLDYNCKAEQESMVAMNLFLKNGRTE